MELIPADRAFHGGRQNLTGALCEQIPDSSPGVAYVAEDGSAEVTRVRACYVTDDDIARISTAYRPPGAGLSD